MARARNIKPGFFKNEDLAECSLAARLCFAGLWTLADREGRLEDRPKRIKAELFAFDSFEVEPLIVELVAHGFLLRYRNSEGSFIQISKFSAHQTPHYSEKPSVIKAPGPPDKPSNGGGTIPGGLQDDSKKDPVIKRGSQPPDSLNPDSLNPSGESTREPPGASEGTPSPAAAKASAPPPKPHRIACPEGVDTAVWADWLTLRKAKRAPVTATVLTGAQSEAAKAGLTLEAFLRVWCRRGSQGLEAAWLMPDERATSANGRGAPPIDTATRDAEARRLLGFAQAAPTREMLDA